MSLLHLFACYSPADYAEDYVAAECDRTLSCYPEESLEYLSYEDQGECLSFHEEDMESRLAFVEEETCTFSPSSAKECTADLLLLGCEEFLSGELPASCEAVCDELE